VRMFPYLTKGDIRSMVTPADVALGHRWKTYILPIDKKFHDGAISAYINRTGPDCILNMCSEEVLEKTRTAQYEDHVAEVPIFRKLLASLHLVDNAEDADLIWVPVLGVSTILECRNYGSCKEAWFQELSGKLPSNSSKPMFFLATQDFSQNHHVIRRQPKSGHIVATLGPSGLIVPSLSVDRRTQPSFFKGCTPPSKRKNFLLANFGVHAGRKYTLQDRETTLQQLTSYQGNKTIANWSERKILSPDKQGSKVGQMDSVMTICPSGDLPFQKRFFDALLHCSIPVVISREIEGVGKTYWSNVDFEKGGPSPRVEDSYPRLEFPYSDLVVEVDGAILQQGKLMEHLENIPWKVLEAKFKRIEAVRTQFLYDYNGTTRDAFSVMLETLWRDFLSKGGQEST